MVKISMRLTFIAIAALLAVASPSACGSSEGPQDRQFDLEIREGKLNMNPAVIKVNQGDTVTLRVKSDEHGDFHLHGYDIEIGVGPDEAAPMRFTASATGRFNITFHASDESGEGGSHEGGSHHEGEEAEVLLATLEVLPR